MVEVGFQNDPSTERYDDIKVGEEKKAKKKKKSKKESKEVDGGEVKKKKKSKHHVEDGLKKSKSKRRYSNTGPKSELEAAGIKKIDRHNHLSANGTLGHLHGDRNSHHHPHHHAPARLDDDGAKDIPESKPQAGRFEYQPTVNERTNPPTLQAERTINWETDEGIHHSDDHDASVITPLTVLEEASLREDVEDPFVPVTTRFGSGSPTGNNSERLQHGAQWEAIGQGGELRKLNHEFRSSEPPRPDSKLSPEEKRRVSLPPSLFPIEENQDGRSWQKKRTGPLSLFPVDETYDRGLGATTSEKSSHRLSYSTTGESYAQPDTQGGGQGGTVDYVATRRATAKDIRRKEDGDGPSYFASSEQYTDENLRDNDRLPSPLDVEVQPSERAGAFALRRTAAMESSQKSEALAELMPDVDRVDQVSQVIREQQAVLSSASVMDAVVDADIENDTLSEKKPTPWYCSGWVKALAVLVVIAGIAVGIAIPLTSSDSDDTGSFTDEQVAARKEQLLGVLTSVSRESQLLNEASPQYAALTWMASQDFMSPIENESRTPRETELMIQRYALAVFYYSMTGDNWFASDGWLDGQREECTWGYLDCVNDDVVSINTGIRNSLAGEIPSELKQLKELRFLMLPSNAITGLSKDMGSLQNLIEVDLSSNKMGGTIPEEIFAFTALRRLLLMDNSFTGTLSPAITNLTDLAELNLYLNRLAGTLTTDFQEFSNLSTLDLGNNEFFGNVNTLFQGMDKLVVVLLTKNRITGSLTSDIQQFSNLEELDLEETDIAGTLPSEIGTLTNLRSLNLEGLGLTGIIPTELGNLLALESVFLRFNDLQGPIPTELCSLPNFTDFAFDCQNECQCQACGMYECD